MFRRFCYTLFRASFKRNDGDLIPSRPRSSTVAFVYCKKGPIACPNSLVLPVRVVEDAVLRAIAGDMLRPALKAMLDAVFEATQPRAAEADVNGLRSDLHAVDTKIANLTAAVGTGSVARAAGDAARTTLEGA
jgi:hypothetical protein